MALIALPLAVLNYLMEGYFSPTVIAFTIGIPLMALNGVLLRRGLSPDTVGIIIVVELMTCLTIMSYYNGGINSASIIWMLPLPLMGQFLLGPRFGVVCALVTVGEVLGFYILDKQGIAMPTTLSTSETLQFHVLGACTSVLFIAGFGWYFDKERRHADTLTRGSEERLRMVVANAEVTLFSTDRNGTITLFAGKEPAALHSSIFEFFPSSEAGLIHEALNGTSCKFSVDIGDRSLEAWLAPTTDNSGAPNGATCLVVDATHRKAMEAQILQSERMASLGTLAAAVGHEINNPLAYILSNMEFVLNELTHPVAMDLPALRSALVDAQEGAQQIRRIVGELRVFTRPDQTGERRDLGAVDVRGVLNSAIAVAAHEMHHRAVLVTDFADTPPVIGSAGPLGQVFLNILINAAQAIAPGAHLENEIRITTRHDARGVVIEISDTGIGIDPEHLSRIYDPFYTTKPAVGTGLGLSTSHRIIESLNGRIEVESRPNVGSCFRVLLPLADAQAVSAMQAASEATPSANVAPPKPDTMPSILVVDDVPALLKSISRMLRAYEVTTATSGRQALKLLSEKHFDVILCDLMMPDQTGIDVYEGLRASSPGDELRIIFMTGGVHTEQAKSFMLGVVNTRLDKPFSPAELRDAVAQRLAAAATVNDASTISG